MLGLQRRRTAGGRNQGKPPAPGGDRPAVLSDTGGDGAPRGFAAVPRPRRRAPFAAILVAAAALGGSLLSCEKGILDPGDKEVREVRFDPDNDTILRGERMRPRVIVTDVDGGNASGRDLFWDSQNDGIATVTPDGVVEGVNLGTTLIAASVDGHDGLLSVTVVDAVIGVGSVTIDQGPIELSVNATQQLTATVLDENGDPLPGQQVEWSSLNESIAFVSSIGVVRGVAVGQTMIVAEAGGKADSVEVTVSAIPVASVTVQPREASILVGGTVQLTAQTLDANNQPLTGRSVTWTSSSNSIATVSSTGLVTGVSPGTVTIKATSEGKTATATVQVNAVPVASVVVTPNPAGVLVGATVQLTATTLDAQGDPITGRTVTWRSSNTNVALVSGTGVVTGVAPGNATITATSEGKSGTTTVEVSAVPVATVEVTPTEASVTIGQEVQLTAVARDADGNILTGRNVTWSSSDQSIAVSSNTGLVVGRAVGTATITATIEGQSATAKVTVTPAPVSSVVVSPSNPQILVGGTVQLSVQVTNSLGQLITNPSVTWQSRDPSIATVNGSGLVTGVAPGTVEIEATSEGKVGIATVTVSPVPVNSVTVSPSTGEVTVGQTVQLTATPRDRDGDPLSGRAITWATTDERIATVSQAGVVTGVAPGTVDISATSEGRTGSAQISVKEVPVASVAVTPDHLELVVGQTGELSAQPRDASDAPLAGRTVTWSSSNTDVATVSGTGVVTAVGAGQATITATSEGVDGTATVTVSTPPVSSVRVTPTSLELDPQETSQLTAATLDRDGNLLTGRLVVWRSDKIDVATVDGTGLVTGVAPGDAKVTAESEGKSGTASVEVLEPAVASVIVDPSSASLTIGDETQLTATPFDSRGNALPNRKVDWRSSDDKTASVSSDGLVTARAAGDATITATSDGKSGSADLTIAPGPAAQIAAVDGDGQTGTPGAVLPVALAVLVTDARGNPVPNTEVTWAVTEGGGSVAPASGPTDPDGRASAAWTLGPEPGTNRLRASVQGVEQPAQFTATGASEPAALVARTGRE